ncbi:uncharacterized protein LOC125199958 [Salvia hispanica]|uniref:uncharacterized protein LOC125189243 n=1 Tax=Salvia hispanica TaxID=49212 RepID=UPI00200981EB|nr:uncharacterized protein LOC125189243 [Salvia hispanica]XP_047953748.1 uncharacterized protein LOC125199958 [Salvia hispanica]
MEKTIIRRSIFTFLKNYQHLTSTPTLLLLPFAVSSLLAPALVSSSRLLPLVHNRLTTLFLAAGFPPSSPLLNLLNLKLSQTILALLFVSPFSYSSLLLAKAAVIRALHPNNNNNNTPFKPLLITQLCNTLLILASNATSFFLIAIFFNCLNFLGLSSPSSSILLSAVGIILYSIILAHAYIICNLALVSSAVERSGGFMAIIKACLVIKGRSATALSLALPINLGLAAIEALFQYRVVKGYNQGLNQSAILVEGMLIAYLYGLTLNLDTVVGYLFWRSCKRDHHIDQEFSHIIEIHVMGDEFCAKAKVLGLLS